MDPIRSRGAYRSRLADAIELGNEPPLSVDGGTSAFVDRRRVSVQWFAGTILTALCGAALMGGAVFTSLDGQANFAALPERVEVALRGALGVSGDRIGGRKSDRLPTAAARCRARRRRPVSIDMRRATVFGPSSPSPAPAIEVGLPQPAPVAVGRPLESTPARCRLALDPSMMARDTREFHCLRR